MVCEAMLPSDYGWSCIGTVTSRLYKYPCSYYSSGHIYCNETYSSRERTIEPAQIEDCSLYEDQEVRGTCHWARTREKGVYECSQIENEMLHDRCQFDFASMQKDSSVCVTISDTKKREHCEYVATLRKEYDE